MFYDQVSRILVSTVGIFSSTDFSSRRVLGDLESRFCPRRGDAYRLKWWWLSPHPLHHHLAKPWTSAIVAWVITSSVDTNHSGGLPLLSQDVWGAAITINTLSTQYWWVILIITQIEIAVSSHNFASHHLTNYSIAALTETANQCCLVYPDGGRRPCTAVRVITSSNAGNHHGGLRWGVMSCGYRHPTILSLIMGGCNHYDSNNSHAPPINLHTII